MTNEILILDYWILIIVDVENLETTLVSGSILEQEWTGMYGDTILIMQHSVGSVTFWRTLKLYNDLSTPYFFLFSFYTASNQILAPVHATQPL